MSTTGHRGGAPPTKKIDALTGQVNHRRANTQLTLIALTQILGLAVWFAANAIAPALRQEWLLSASATVWLTATVQVGFAVGAVTASVLALPDRLPAPLLMAGSALGISACTAAFALLSSGLTTALPLRFLTGVLLAGVYPIGMKLTASWTRPIDRGRAFGVLIGSLTLGSAMPHLVSSFGGLPWRSVMLVASGMALVAALVTVCGVRTGPLLVAAAPARPRQMLEGFRARRPLLVNIGYLGHMWELYAFWTWLPAFLMAVHANREIADVAPIVFTTVGLAGVVGCLLGGWAADRYGRPTAAAAALLVSGLCAIASPIVFVAPPSVAAALLVVWGAAVIADSGVFSAALSEAAEGRYVGTALTMQTAVGFLLTVASIQLVPLAADLVGWQFAFWVLVPGPVLGVAAMALLRRDSLKPPAATAAS
ncbi:MULTISPECIES: MFS transporter [Mycolicibacterium]|jgi:MFS family permease|uniref:MFS transporter n=1 Tax=Mycolicibacterium TaxID=1866885 RepID=UPI001CA33AF1|nr:MFS transporter [Mycolicibacterium austroafricanum]QZT55072.1 MFS transporter [Mycolicibacterium austroafricanum]